MNPTSKWQLAASLAIALTLGACGKKEGEEQIAAPPAETPPPAAAPAATQPDATPPAATAPAADTAAAPSTAEADAKAAAIQIALAEEAIATDPRGQWAVTASASSTYSGNKDPGSDAAYTPRMATGAPDVERYSDDGKSWATETAEKGIEWLEVTFAKPVHATELRVRQNYAPGAIIKLELIDEGGARHAVWQGIDDQKYSANTIGWFKLTFEKTPYATVGARITLATNAVPGWNEIDAVQLLGD